MKLLKFATYRAQNLYSAMCCEVKSIDHVRIQPAGSVPIDMFIITCGAMSYINGPL